MGTGRGDSVGFLMRGAVLSLVVTLKCWLRRPASRAVQELA